MTAAINEIALPSPIACVNKGSQLRLYQLGNDGSVREVMYEGKWTGGSSSNTVGTVKLTSPLAATSLELNSIRVYGIDANNTVSEFAYDSDKGWYRGGMTGKFKVAPYSGIAAVFLARKAKIRVYVQAEDDSIQEYSYDSDRGWYKDQNLGKAMPGTAIAATAWGANESEIGIRVYFQDPSGNIKEKAHDAKSTWYDGGLNFKASMPRAPLAAVSWDGASHIRVYYGTADHKVCEKAWDGGKGWYDGGFAKDCVPGSRAACLTVGSSDLRVYLQNGTSVSAFSEYVFGRNNWTQGASPLPPA